MEKAKNSHVSEEEIEHIRGQASSLDEMHHALGFLVAIRRNGSSLDEVHSDARSQPDQEEHHEAMNGARDLLRRNAEKLELDG